MPAPACPPDLPPLPDDLPPPPENGLPPLPPPPAPRTPLDKAAVLLWILAGAAGIAALQFNGAVEPARREQARLQAAINTEQRACMAQQIVVDVRTKRLAELSTEGQRADALGKEVERLTADMKEALRRYQADEAAARQRIRELESQKRALAAASARRASTPQRHEPASSERFEPVSPSTVKPPEPAASPGGRTDGDVIALVEQYVRNRANGDGYRLSRQFADVVNYKYSGFKNVSRSTVMDDIRSGWDKWPGRSYRLIRAGYNESVVELAFRYEFRTASGKRVSGYSKETWTLDDQNRISAWTETTSRQAPPPLSPGLNIIEF